jgi:hypothetical protein
MEQEAQDILEMVKDGRVSPEQGAQLLEALKAPAPGALPAGQSKPQFIRVRVHVKQGDADKVVVNSNIPIALAEVALKMAEGAKITRDGETIVLSDFLKQMGGVNLADILQMVREGAEGKLVDVDVDDGDQQVKVEVVVD